MKKSKSFSCIVVAVIAILATSCHRNKSITSSKKLEHTTEVKNAPKDPIPWSYEYTIARKLTEEKIKQGDFYSSAEISLSYTIQTPTTEVINGTFVERDTVANHTVDLPRLSLGKVVEVRENGTYYLVMFHKLDLQTNEDQQYKFGFRRRADGTFGIDPASTGTIASGQIWKYTPKDALSIPILMFERNAKVTVQSMRH